MFFRPLLHSGPSRIRRYRAPTLPTTTVPDHHRSRTPPYAVTLDLVCLNDEMESVVSGLLSSMRHSVFAPTKKSSSSSSKRHKCKVHSAQTTACLQSENTTICFVSKQIMQSAPVKILFVISTSEHFLHIGHVFRITTHWHSPRTRHLWQKCASVVWVHLLEQEGTVQWMDNGKSISPAF